MIFKTRGIVLRNTKFGETSVVANVYTEKFGLQSYLINGVRKRTQGKAALFQPLTLLDMVVYHRENANLNRLKEVKCLHNYRYISVDVRKSSIALFINEMLNKCLREERQEEQLFDFLFNSLILLDEINHAENHHLIFLLKFSRFLGFGIYRPGDVLEKKMASPVIEDTLYHLIHAHYHIPMHIEWEARKELLDLLIQFYANHIENFGQVRSVAVLREVLS